MVFRRWSTTALAVALPAAVAWAGTPFRAQLSAADVAAVLVGVVAVVGAVGVRATPVLAAASAAMAFDMAWAAPDGTLRVRDPADRLSAVVLLVVGATLAELGRRRRARWRRPWRRPRLWRSRDEEALDHLHTVGRVAADIAEGDDAGLVLLDVSCALVELLDLRDCAFEQPPFPPGERPVLLHTGELELRGVRWDPARTGLPTRGFAIPVAARGHVEGRFLCVPRRPGTVRPDRVVVALTLVDQAASAVVLSSAV
jgi:hypothetical protein